MSLCPRGASHPGLLSQQSSVQAHLSSPPCPLSPPPTPVLSHNPGRLRGALDAGDWGFGHTFQHLPETLQRHSGCLQDLGLSPGGPCSSVEGFLRKGSLLHRQAPVSGPPSL